MADRRDDELPEANREAGQASHETSGGPAPVGMGRGYGRDFGAAGRDQGFDGSHGEGYGGSVPRPERTWLDETAERRLRGPHQGRGPQGWRRSDQQLADEVCERLSEDRLIDARGIEVEVRDGVVTLTGEAFGASDPLLAERLVRQVGGVKDVVVELVVQPRPGGSMPRQPAQDDGRTDHSPLGYPILPT